MSVVAAAEMFDLNQIKALIKEEAPIDEKNDVGETALHICIARKDFVRVLLAASASPNARNLNGSTPLHKAAIRRDRTVINALLKANADPNIKNKAGYYPENYCTSSVDCIAAILKDNIKEDKVPLKESTRHVIGKKGVTLKKIVTASGSSIQIMKGQTNEAVINGRKECNKIAKDLILEIVYPNRGKNLEDTKSRKNLVKCPIQKGKYGKIIGKKGATIKKLQNDFKCTIQFPDTSEISKANSDVVEIWGENFELVQSCVNRIHELVSKDFRDYNQYQGERKPRGNPNSTSKPVPKTTTNALPINHR